MKKILATLLAVACFATASFAQPKKTEKVKVEVKKEIVTPAKKEATKLKADGTPDKRFKDNKAATPAGPTKKDGTLDMRYKANKDAKKKA
jgi:hypothetical protein